MPDWKRLGDHVIARRDEFGWTRQELAETSHISPRILGDIETGRREGRFDRTTIARLERALRWKTGSTQQVAEGGEATPITEPAAASERDRLVIKIMARDDITDADKQKIVELLIAQREADERARAEQAQRLVDMLRRDPNN